MSENNPSHDEFEVKLTALILGELDAAEAAEVEAVVARDPALATLREQLRRAAELVRATYSQPEAPSGSPFAPLPRMNPDRREVLLARLRRPVAEKSAEPTGESGANPVSGQRVIPVRFEGEKEGASEGLGNLGTPLWLMLAACLVLLLGAASLFLGQRQSWAPQAMAMRPLEKAGEFDQRQISRTAVESEERDALGWSVATLRTDLQERTAASEGVAVIPRSGADPLAAGVTPSAGTSLALGDVPLLGQRFGRATDGPPVPSAAPSAAPPTPAPAAASAAASAPAPMPVAPVTFFALAPAMEAAQSTPPSSAPAQAAPEGFGVASAAGVPTDPMSRSAGTVPALRYQAIDSPDQVDRFNFQVPLAADSRYGNEIAGRGGSAMSRSEGEPRPVEAAKPTTWAMDVSRGLTEASPGAVPQRGTEVAVGEAVTIVNGPVVGVTDLSANGLGGRELFGGGGGGGGAGSARVAGGAVDRLSERSSLSDFAESRVPEAPSPVEGNRAKEKVAGRDSFDAKDAGLRGEMESSRGRTLARPASRMLSDEEAVDPGAKKESLVELERRDTVPEESRRRARAQVRLEARSEVESLGKQVTAEDLERKSTVQAAEVPEPQPEVATRENAFSTFSLNVADVSFKLADASLANGVLPAPGSIRSEEFLNAFQYRDPEPAGHAPLAFAWERATYPYAHRREVLRFAVRTAAVGREAGRPLNLVLALDNSGSMERADRVAILREALRTLAAQLKAGDRISVVAFARTPRLWVDGLPGERAGEILDAVGALTPEGGTNLEDALRTAYELALRHYSVAGVNRVVLLTDGAANLGEVRPEPLRRMVEEQRKRGIALDCFGVGWEGYNDDLLESLSRNGDGRYGFVNSVEEASTGFATQLAGALRVAASDVKVQVEFNSGRVSVWRQVGYAKHRLTREQFRDNTVDAAEIGAAESGNALYVVEVNAEGEGPIGVVRVRYRSPETGEYDEQEWVVPFEGPAVALEAASPAMRLAAVAGAFAESLAGSPFATEVSLDRLQGLMQGVPDAFAPDPRPARLQAMLREAGSLGAR